MPVDAQISQVDLLVRFAGHLAAFDQAVILNTTSFVSLLEQKLAELKTMLHKAEAIQKRLELEHAELFHQAASCNPQQRNSLQVRLQEAEHRLRIANRNLSEIALQVGRAENAVICMIDRNQKFKNEVSDHVEKGRTFLKKQVAALEQYKEGAKNV